MTRDQADEIIRPLLGINASSKVEPEERAVFIAGMRTAADMCDDDPGEMGEHIANAIRSAADKLSKP